MRIGSNSSRVCLCACLSIRVEYPVEYTQYWWIYLIRLLLHFYSCDRVSQLEHEPTRKHNLESHLPLRKQKPPPWQKQLDVSTDRYHM